MRAIVRLGAGVAIVTIMLMSSRGAAAFGANLTLTQYAGRATETFQFTHTLLRQAGDPACPEKTQVALTWDGIPLGSVAMDCETLSASGVVTPPAAANDLGRHEFCVENGSASSVIPLLCVPYTIVPEPGECDPTGTWSPPCAGPTYATFEPDCLPNTQESSPPCVTLTPIPIVCDATGLGPSPPCADTPTPIASGTPEVTETPVDESTSTPTVAATRTFTTTPTPTRTVVRVCGGTSSPRAGTASPDAGACVTATPTSASDGGGDDVSVNWTAVVVAVVVVAGAGGAAAGGWVFLRR